MSQSRSLAQNLYYHQKGLVIKNTHAKYESPMSFGLNVCAELKFSIFRSNVTVNVDVVPSEKSCHKEHTCQI